MRRYGVLCSMKVFSLIFIWALCVILSVHGKNYDKDSFLRIASEDKDYSRRVSALLDLGDHFSTLNKDSAIMYAKEAFEISQRVNNIRGEANALYCYGLAYLNSGELMKARSYYQQGIKLCEDHKESDGKIEGYLHFSTFYHLLGKTDSMKYYAFNALELSQKTKIISLKAGAAQHIGNYYMVEGDFAKALFYCQQTLQIWQSMGQANIAGIYSDIGNIYYKEKIYPKALEYYGKAYDNAVKTNDLDAFGFSLNNIGLVYYQLDSPDAAINYYKRAIKYYTSNSNGFGISNTQANLADAYLKSRQYKLALEIAQNGLIIARELHFQKLMLQLSTAIAEADGGLGNYKEAWINQKLASRYQDSVNQLTITQAATDYQTKIEIEKKDHENNLLKEEGERQKVELTTKNQLTFFIGTIMILCLIIALIALNSSTKRKRQLLLMAKLNEEITEQKKILEETDELKTKLFSIVSHDFKSPLASLQLFLSMFEEGDFTKDEVKELSGKLMERMNVTFSFIENLLGWAQSQMNGYIPNFSTLNLYNIAAENFELYRKQAEAKEITFHNQINTDEEMVADENMLKLVLRNLMSNAIKYTEKGGEVKISSTRNDNYVFISVCDTGVGMTEAMMHKIFTSQRVNTYGTDNEPGTGLGLMLCREFLEKIGGSISVKSEVGKGSVFSVNIPLQQ